MSRQYKEPTIEKEKKYSWIGKSCTVIQPRKDVGSGGGGGGTQQTGRLRPEVQTLSLLYTICDRKVKMVPLSYTCGASFAQQPLKKLR